MVYKSVRFAYISDYFPRPSRSLPHRFHAFGGRSFLGLPALSAAEGSRVEGSSVISSAATGDYLCPPHLRFLHPDSSTGTSCDVCGSRAEMPFPSHGTRITGHALVPSALKRPLSLFFSHSCALFCLSHFAISRIFSSFRTLFAKHPGWGTPQLIHAT